MEASQLFLGVLFGSIGLAYFIYGKKQRSVVPLVSGLALMAFPYFVSSTTLIVLIGAALATLPYFFKM